MRAVNLLPREERKGRGALMTVGVQLALASGFLAVSVLAAGYLLTNSKVNDRRATLNALEHELAAIPPTTRRQSAGNQQLTLQRDQRIAALGAALQSRVAWDRILREISSILPEDVWLTSLSATSPQAPAPAPVPAPSPDAASGTTTTTTPAPPPAPNPSTSSGAPLSIEGYTYSQAGVARFLGRLAVIPELQNVKLIQSTQSKVGGRDVFQFQIKAGIQSAVAS